MSEWNKTDSHKKEAPHDLVSFSSRQFSINLSHFPSGSPPPPALIHSGAGRRQGIKVAKNVLTVSVRLVAAFYSLHLT